MVVGKGNHRRGDPRQHQEHQRRDCRELKVAHSHDQDNGANHVELRIIRQVPTPEHALRIWRKKG